MLTRVSAVHECANAVADFPAAWGRRRHHGGGGGADRLDGPAEVDAGGFAAFANFVNVFPSEIGELPLLKNKNQVSIPRLRKIQKYQSVGFRATARTLTRT